MQEPDKNQGIRKGPRSGPFLLVAPVAMSRPIAARQLLWRVLVIGCLLAFWACDYLKGHFLAFFERTESVHLDCGEMRKHVIRTIVGFNEAKSLVFFKKFYNPCLS